MHANRCVAPGAKMRGVFAMKWRFDRFAGNRRSGFVLILALLSSLLTSCGNSGSRPAGQTLPPPDNVQVTCVKQGAKVSWNSVPGASHYTVFWGLAPRDYHSLADSQSRSVIVTGLQPGKLYAFAVSSWNGAGESDFSGEELLVFDDGRGSPTEYLAQARQRMKEGSLREAQAYVAAAIRLDPRFSDAYRLRGELHEQSNKPELASQDYAKAEKLFNGNRVTLQRSTD
jgi:hypothetical protein